MAVKNQDWKKYKTFRVAKTQVKRTVSENGTRKDITQ